MKSTSSSHPLLLLSGLFLICFLASGVLQTIVLQFKWSNQTTVYVSMAFQQVIGFLLPAILFLKYRNSQESIFVDFKQFFLKLLIISPLFIAAFLLSERLQLWNFNWLSQYNLPLLEQMEEQSNNIMMQFLTIENPIFLQIILLAVLPAICEEFLFRGALLRAFSNNTNIHVANGITALIFTLLHFQPYKFVPMFILAILLGYLYIYTRNILFPILFHFMNNALGIIFFSGSLSIENGLETTIPTLYLIIVVLGLIIFLSQKWPEKSFKI